MCLLKAIGVVFFEARFELLDSSESLPSLDQFRHFPRARGLRGALQIITRAISQHADTPGVIPSKTCARTRTQTQIGRRQVHADQASASELRLYGVRQPTHAALFFEFICN